MKVDPATEDSEDKPLKLEKTRARLELRKHFFYNLDAWNALPARPRGRSYIDQHVQGRLTTATVMRR